MLGSADFYTTVLSPTSLEKGPLLLEQINLGAYLRCGQQHLRKMNSPFGSNTLGNTAPREWEAITSFCARS